MYCDSSAFPRSERGFGFISWCRWAVGAVVWGLSWWGYERWCAAELLGVVTGRVTSGSYDVSVQSPIHIGRIAPHVTPSKSHPKRGQY
ncbi:hypothetical protein BT67DRAFT_91079 [Trichocladium antarcticum]|uniref:Uncharacterized protein n=1 Tax=Trichocladium antarcticum TaxID=1450529 RepID=A0AAN6UFL4_9PEZI|nr:hypothetical protein BT67DRAFT_91079 [Trichocladium antarcticum]